MNRLECTEAESHPHTHTPTYIHTLIQKKSTAENETVQANKSEIEKQIVSRVFVFVCMRERERKRERERERERERVCMY